MCWENTISIICHMFLILLQKMACLRTALSAMIEEIQDLMAYLIDTTLTSDPSRQLDFIWSKKDISININYMAMGEKRTMF